MKRYAATLASAELPITCRQAQGLVQDAVADTAHRVVAYACKVTAGTCAARTVASCHADARANAQDHHLRLLRHAGAMEPCDTDAARSVLSTHGTDVSGARAASLDGIRATAAVHQQRQPYRT